MDLGRGSFLNGVGTFYADGTSANVPPSRYWTRLKDAVAPWT
jgi:hypothetical protein